MEITIIIPVYNRAEVLMRTLLSVLAQTYRPLHVVLVDNGSTDASLELLQHFKEEHEAPDFKVTVCAESVRGAAAARNRGLDEAASEWVMFFDSDDEMAPSLVERYAAAIADNPQADIVYTDVEIVSDENGASCIKYAPRKNMLSGNIFHSYLSTQRYIVRKATVEAAGRWNPQMLGWNDWELGVRLLLTTSRMVKLSTPHPLVLVHAHADSITGRNYSDKAKIWESSINAAARVIENSGRKDTRLLSDCLEYKRIMLAGNYAHEGSAEGERLYGEVCARVRRRPAMHLICFCGYKLISRGVRGTARIAEILFRLLD